MNDSDERHEVRWDEVMMSASQRVMCIVNIYWDGIHIGEG